MEDTVAKRFIAAGYVLSSSFLVKPMLIVVSTELIFTKYSPLANVGDVVVQDISFKITP